MSLLLSRLVESDDGSIVPPSVSTVSSSNVSADSADVTGDLTDLGSTSPVAVSVQFRETGMSTWEETASESKTAPGQYTQTVSGLSSDTQHEFRAKADGDGVDTGSIQTFTTDNSAGPPSSAIGHYDWSDNSSTTSKVENLVGSSNLTGTFSSLNATINGTQAGDFDGVDDFLSTGTFLPDYTSTGFSFSFVFKQPSSSPTELPLVVWNGQDGQAYSAFRLNGGDLAINFRGSGSNNFQNVPTGKSVNDNTPHVAIASMDLSSSTAKVYLDNVKVLNTTNSELDKNWNFGSDGATLRAGGVKSGRFLYDGVIAEIIWYDDVLSDTQLSDESSRLMNKWGIQ